MVPSFSFMFGRNLEGIPLPAYELLFKSDSRKCKTEPIYFCPADDTIYLLQGSDESYDTYELCPDAIRISPGRQFDYGTPHGEQQRDFRCWKTGEDNAGLPSSKEASHGQVGAHTIGFQPSEKRIAHRQRVEERGQTEYGNRWRMAGGATSFSDLMFLRIDGGCHSAVTIKNTLEAAVLEFLLPTK
jgi:hypothetical protein